MHITQLVITGWWAAASTCIHTETLYLEGQHTISKWASALRFHPPAADILMNDPTNSRWQDGDLWHLFISGGGAHMFEIACFCLLCADCLLFPDNPEGWLSWQRADGTEEMCKSNSLTLFHVGNIVALHAHGDAHFDFHAPQRIYYGLLFSFLCVCVCLYVHIFIFTCLIFQLLQKLYLPLLLEDWKWKIKLLKF